MGRRPVHAAVYPALRGPGGGGTEAGVTGTAHPQLHQEEPGGPGQEEFTDSQFTDSRVTDLRVTDSRVTCPTGG